MDGYADPNIEFYRIVQGSYEPDEFRGMTTRMNLAVRVAKVRGLIPWDYDGEREATLSGMTYEDIRRAGDDEGRGSFDWPDAPEGSA